MILLLIFLFTALPVFELYLLFQAGSHIGVLKTIGVVILTGVVGAYMARAQGFVLMQKIQSQMQSGQLPADSLMHGFLVLAGGLLLMTPGFVTDVFGFSMVLPGTRYIYLQLFRTWLHQKIQRGQFHFYSNVNMSGFGGRPGNDHQQSGQHPIEEFERQFDQANVTKLKDVTPKD